MHSLQEGAVLSWVCWQLSKTLYQLWHRLGERIELRLTVFPLKDLPTELGRCFCRLSGSSYDYR